MLCFLLSFFAIDLGTQYYKCSEDNFNAPKPYEFPNKKARFLTSIAFQTKKEISGPILSNDANNTNIKFGKSALSILKKNTNKGYHLLPMTFGRNIAEFSTTKLVNPISALALSLGHIFKFNYKDGLLFVVPAFWTKQQRIFLESTCELFEIPYLGTITDVQALAQIYSNLKYQRYAKKNESDNHPYKVMFIDIGSTSTKIYGLEFKWTGTKSDVKQILTLWNERIGGYHFQKKVAITNKVSMKKALKILRKGETKDIELEMTEFKSLLNNAKEQMKDVNEIQLIGGSMSYSFIVNAIKESFDNLTVIRKEFDPTNTISQGGAYFGLQVKDALPYPQCNFTKQNLYDLTLTFSHEHNLCKNGTCEAEIKENGKGVQMITIKGNINDIPRGSSNIYDKYLLTNITNLTFSENDNSYGIINLNENQDITSIQWCKEENECNVISFKNTLRYDFMNQINPASYDLYISLRNKETKQEKIGLLYSLLEEVDVFIREFNLESDPKLKEFQDFYHSIKDLPYTELTNEIMDKANTIIKDTYEIIQKSPLFKDIKDNYNPNQQ